MNFEEAKKFERWTKLKIELSDKLALLQSLCELFIFYICNTLNWYEKWKQYLI